MTPDPAAIRVERVTVFADAIEAAALSAYSQDILNEMERAGYVFIRLDALERAQRVVGAVQEFLLAQGIEPNRCPCDDGAWDGLRRPPCLWEASANLRDALAAYDAAEP